MLLIEKIYQLARDDQGATATEYSIMLVLIILVSLATIIILGDKVENAFNLFATMLANATNS
jgi:Flp pilus assembly pilin Flp